MADYDRQSFPDEPVDLSIPPADLWRIYDLVSAKTEALTRAEEEAMVSLGAEPWRLLRRRIRIRLPLPEVPS